MVYLIHLETKRNQVKHCIAILDIHAGEELKLYYVQPGSHLMANLLALDAEWTAIRLWQDLPWYKRWLWCSPKLKGTCPVCGVAC